MHIIRQHYCRDKKIKTVGEYIRDFYNANAESLRANYPGLTERRLLQEYLFNSGLDKDEVFVRPYSNFFGQISKGVPLEYINRNCFFFEHNFYVSPAVLIPRSETEVLVEMACQLLQKNTAMTSICEVGVGSGAIILSILARVGRPLEAEASDISSDALKVAGDNYFLLKNCIHPQTQLTFLLRDRLMECQRKFDLIVSNPPYIKAQEDLSTVHHQVRQFEPHIALFLRDQEYDQWFEQLFQQVKACLIPGGKFMMEGHEQHLPQLQQMAGQYFDQVSLHQDLTGRLRFLKAELKGI